MKSTNSSVNTQPLLTRTINISSRYQVSYLAIHQTRHLLALLHNSYNWPTQHKWYAQRAIVCLMFFIFPQSGYNTRVKAIHILNSKPWIEKVIAMFKMALKTKVLSRVSVTAHFLSLSSHSLLFQHIQIYIHKMKLLDLLQSKSCKIYKYVLSNVIIQI
jgi:hypothetical protein